MFGSNFVFLPINGNETAALYCQTGNLANTANIKKEKKNKFGNNRHSTYLQEVSLQMGQRERK